MGDAENIAERGLGGNVLAALGGQALRWAVVPLAGAALAPLALIATGAVGGPSSAAALASPLSVLAARSPGERAPGVLTQTKNRGPALEQKKLNELLSRPLIPGAPGVVGAVPGPLVEGAPEAVPEDSLPVAEAGTPDVLLGPLVPSLGPVIGPIFAADTIPGVGGGGGGGGTTPGGGTSVTPEVPGVTPSVPEPSTWAMLILGFGLVGGAMRSRRSRAAGESALQPIG